MVTPSGGRGWRRRRVVVPAAGVLVLAGAAVAALLLLGRPAGGLSLHPPSVRLLVGHRVTLRARLAGSAAHPRWRSSDPAIVSVTDTGLVAARAPGTATVSASIRGHTASARVTGVGIHALRLTVPGTIGYGETVTATVRETLTDGTTPRRAPFPVRVSAAAGGPLAVTGTSVLGTALGTGMLVVRGPDGPPASARVRVLPSVPTNLGTVTPGFVAHAPLAIQIDNGPTSDPHTGLQAADIVYEYATEGGITRFTAVYWHIRPAATVGPLRSARLIDIPIEQMYQGLVVFSGASNGTYANLIHQHVPLLTDDCCGQDFFRTANHVAPSNLFSQGRLLLGGLASGFPSLAHQTLAYALLAPHVDRLHPGPIRTVTIDQTPVNIPAYHYNPVSRTWQRWLNGTPQIDTSTGQPIAVRTLIVLTAPWHYTNYVEDVLGNHSIYWDLNTSGPFQAFIDGLQFSGTWHRPADGGPILYTVAGGHPLPLPTGLTWVEVVPADTPVSISD